MNAHDRCDRCSAQAYLRVSFSAGELLFCGHNYDACKDSFPATASVEEDTRSVLVSA